MDKILSQDEVDALLRGVTGGEIDTTPQVEETPEGPVPYDLGNQEWIVRGRMPTLDIIHQQFARLFRMALGDALRKPVEVTVTNQAVMKFGDFIKRLPLPAYLMIIAMEPLRGFALLATDATTVYLLVDHFFGGSGQTYVKPEGQDFTLIEQRVMHRVMGLALKNLEKAWEPVHRVSIKAVRAEMNPQLAAIVIPSEIVIVVTVGVELADTVGDVHLCLPYAMLEPLREKLQTSFQSDLYEVDQSWITRFCARMQEATVTLTVHLGSAMISVEDLLNFRVGDVVVLDQAVTQPLLATVEGTPKFTGFGVKLNGVQHFRIEQILLPPET
ncbi:MAG: flagellar motor switch protein FliM [Nitrospirae bacterium]|nr:MAG: flagellar motor switch protein FliM [Nitrospirota bacterium]